MIPPSSKVVQSKYALSSSHFCFRTRVSSTSLSLAKISTLRATEQNYGHLDMRRPLPLSFRFTSSVFQNAVSHNTGPPIVSISNATFYRQHPSSKGQDNTANPALFPNLTFSIPSFSSEPHHWAVIGPSSSGKTAFLEILRGQHICIPPTARSFPYLSSDEIAAKDHHLRVPGRAIQYVGFNGKGAGAGGSSTQGAYLSARYESRREGTDFSLLDYLKGNTDLNPLDREDRGTIMQQEDDRILEKIVKDLRLEDLVDMPVGNLSNGQTRRARIAKALMGIPEVLLLDEPFMGLDPATLMMLSPLLHALAKESAPRLVLALRPQDPVPEWITHLTYLGPDQRIAFQGLKSDVWLQLQAEVRGVTGSTLPGFSHLRLFSLDEVGRPLTTKGIEESEPFTKTRKPRHELTSSRDGLPFATEEASKIGEPIVQMQGIRVKYGDKAVLGEWEQDLQGQPKRGLWWTVNRGERWGIFGPNGSGKTTILSLICSDHPQTYSLPVKLFGRSRLPQPGQPGISIFDIQARIGHSSPEVHAFFPRNLTLRQTLENAWADTFLGKPILNHDRDIRVDACLRWFKRELYPSPGDLMDPLDGLIFQRFLAHEKHVEQKLTPRREAHLKKKFAEQLAKYEAIDIDWGDEVRFGDVPFSAQKVALFLRAIIKSPDLVILDEAFSGMDETMRDKCMMFLAWGETRWFKYSGKQGRCRTAARTVSDRLGKVTVTGLSDDQALICVSHVKEEVPGLVRQWMCLPDAHTGRPARFGRLDGPLERDYSRWEEIWGM